MIQSIPNRQNHCPTLSFVPVQFVCLKGCVFRQTWTAALPGWHTQALNDTMILAHMHHHVHLVIIMDTLIREKNRAYAKIGQKNLMGTSVPENVYQRRPKST